MSEPTRTLVAYCPECDTRIRFHEEPRLGQLITCHECGEVSEVISLNPLELEWSEGDSDSQPSKYRNYRR